MNNGVLGFIFSYTASKKKKKKQHFCSKTPSCSIFLMFPLFSITSLRVTERIVIRVNRMPINIHPSGFPFYFITYTNSCLVLYQSPHTGTHLHFSPHFFSLLFQAHPGTGKWLSSNRGYSQPEALFQYFSPTLISLTSIANTFVQLNHKTCCCILHML